MKSTSMLVVAAIVATGQAIPRAQWDAADRKVVRLAPEAFPQLPASIRDALHKRGCTVPQPDGARKPEGVISGSFLAAKETDWAVLCSSDRRSSVLVFRQGRADSVQTVAAPRPDLDRLELFDPPDHIGFGRAIRSAPAAEVVRRARDKEEPPPDPLPAHDSIEDVFVGKASEIFYWRGGRWTVIGGGN